MLHAPDFDHPFVVQTDVLAVELRAMLTQGEGPNKHSVMYLSWKLNRAEQAYSVIEREALAIKWALQALKYYLLGAPFVLVMDHTPLTWLCRMDANPHLTRWYMALQPFAFTTCCQKGLSHCNTDFFSRQDLETPWLVCRLRLPPDEAGTPRAEARSHAPCTLPGGGNTRRGVAGAHVPLQHPRGW